MGVFKLGKMTFGSLFKKPETVKYPFETKPQPQGLKGHIVLDADNCILCGMCEKSCPTDCITVNKENRIWNIIPFQCIQCGYCTQVCPKKCLAMDPNYWAASVSKSTNSIPVPDQKKDDQKPAKADQSNEPVANAEKAPEPAKPASDADVKEPVAIDGELEAKLAIMEADKAERVRKALLSR